MKCSRRIRPIVSTTSIPHRPLHAKAGSRTNRKFGGQSWTPIPRLRGSFFHAGSHSGFRLVWLVFGFAEKPDVPAALRVHPEALECDPDEASFFLGRETPVPSLRPHLSAWQPRLYAFMTRNAVAAPAYFLLLSHRPVELGAAGVMFA